MDACVDPLVLQLEDEDPRVRLVTLEKLRKVAAVENVHFPVRNPRRFLQCLRRRALDEDAEVAREARRLVVDVMPALGDDAEQILSSILPHLIPHLPNPVSTQSSGTDNEEAGSAFIDDEVYRVFRKYVAVCNDLKAVAELLVNSGLAHGRASVREASLVVITRLLDERFLHKRKPGASSTSSIAASRMDKALFVALLQATVPTLEDSDEGVIVAAEETIAKLQLYWGQTFQTEAAQFLSNEDNRTLRLHQQHISQFLAAAPSSGPSTSPASSSSPSSLSLSSQSSQSWLSPPASKSIPALVTDLQGDADATGSVPAQSCEVEDGDTLFGFVSSDVMETLATSRSNSNADWKKRSAAVEQLFQFAKQAVTCTVKEHICEMDPLFATLARLMQDVDAHIVKRALQTTELVFSKLVAGDSSSGSEATGVAVFMLRLLHSLVETAASFSDDKDVRVMTYAVLSQCFASDCAGIAQFQHALVTSSLQSRRLQVREEALRVWSLLLVSSHERHHNAFRSGDGHPSAPFPKASLMDDTSIQVLGKLLGDTSVRVRDTAMETAVVFGRVVQADVYALLESHVDDQYVAERIDWATLRRRLRQKQTPQRAQVSPLCSAVSVHAAVDKSLPGSSELQTMVLHASQTLAEESTNSSPSHKAGESTFIPRSRVEDASSISAQCEGTGSSGVWGSLSDRSYFDGMASSPHASDGVQSARQQRWGAITHEEMADKLSALKKKASQLRRTTSVKHVVSALAERDSAVYQTEPQRSSPARSMTSPERLAHPLSHTLVPDDVHPSSVGYSPRSDTTPAGFPARRQRDAVAEAPFGDDRHVNSYQQLSPQKLQDIQTQSVNHENRPIRSRFQDTKLQADTPGVSPDFSDDRPIRQLADVSSLYLDQDADYPSPIDNNELDGGNKSKPGTAAPVSLATRKRLEAKQRQEQQERQRLQEGRDALQTTDTQLKTGHAASTTSESDEEVVDTGRTAARPISLATRKRLEAKAKQSRPSSERTASPVAALPSTPDTEGQDEDEVVTKPKRSVRGAVKKTITQEKRGDDCKPRGSALGSQEPRYLETHELTLVANPKQEAASLVSKISRPDDWLTNFEALTTVRRLAVHSPSFLEDKIHAVVAAILAQVTNLRSTVSKNALLALESMCAAFGRALDGEVDAIAPLLLKRCADSNQFVCESASVSLSSVARHCSTMRVVSALNSHLTSRAAPIRREVARCMLTLLSVTVEREGQSQQPAALSAILSVVGKCLEDSNNEVRDAAKQALLFLVVDQNMDVSRVKKMLPAGGAAHAKLDQLVASKASFTTSMPRNPAKASSNVSASSVAPTSSMSSGTRGNSATTATAAGARPPPAQGSGKAPALDVEAFEQMQKRLDSSNWKDRFEALEEASALATSSAAALTASGRVVPLFDVLVKRLDDGNAKVSALALERLGAVLIPVLGDGLAPVLGLLLPALSKQLAANSARMAALASDALKALGANVDARLLCQYLAPLARLGNARVKPLLVDSLAQLAAASDEKLQPALTRYVVPLALELLKEAKTEVKDANGRLLVALKSALGAAVLQQAASKLSAALQDKLAAGMVPV